MDQGIHEFVLLVTAGDPNDVRSRISALADWLDAPPLAYAHLPTDFPQGPSKDAPDVSADGTPLLSLEPTSVRLTACKRSYDGEALVIRLQETVGIESRARIGLHQPGCEVNVSLRPYEIKTIRIEPNGSWREVDAIDENR